MARTMSGPGASRRPAAGLAGRLFAALAVVVGAGALTAWLVATLLGPSVFHDHMVQAGLTSDDPVVAHAEEAFASASTLSLTVAVVSAVLTSLAVSAFLTSRISRSLSSLTTAATQVAGGRYDARVSAPRIGAEFDELAEAFNHMAARLDDGERLRRRLLSDVAHEVRTPVATLAAYLEGLEDGVATLQPDTLDVLRAETSRLTRLTEDLAAVTRAESGELPLRPRRVATRALVAAATGAFCDRFAAAGTTLNEDVAGDLPELLVDPDRIGQVFGNLLDNALRHAPGGEVTLSAERAGDQVRFVVSDTGDGIAAEHLPRLFERFYRADTARDRERGGSGIGLAIAKALVESHGGTISASSPGPGRGSRFEVLLPTG